jgi:mRNA interferase MazF
VAGRLARGDIRPYHFAPDKKRPVLILTRASAVPYLSTVTVAPVTSTIRGVPSEVLRNEEDGMKNALCGEPAQRSDHLPGPLGKAGSTIEFITHERNLRRSAFLTWLRCQFTVARVGYSRS